MALKEAESVDGLIHDIKTLWNQDIVELLYQYAVSSTPRQLFLYSTTALGFVTSCGSTAQSFERFRKPAKRPRRKLF